jgi:hypothetical protein
MLSRVRTLTHITPRSLVAVHPTSIRHLTTTRMTMAPEAQKDITQTPVCKLLFLFLIS